MALNVYIIKNSKNGIEIEINEYLFLRILTILKTRDKRLYEITKEKYEQLEQKNLNDKILDLK